MAPQIALKGRKIPGFEVKTLHGLNSFFVTVVLLCFVSLLFHFVSFSFPKFFLSKCIPCLTFVIKRIMMSWCSSCHNCALSFNKALHSVLHMFQSSSLCWRFGMVRTSDNASGWK